MNSQKSTNFIFFAHFVSEKDKKCSPSPSLFGMIGEYLLENMGV